MMKLLNYQVADHLKDIFNLPFKTIVFPDSLKIAKLIPIHKKDSKLILFQIIDPFLFYPIWIKLLRSWCKTYLCIFLKKRRFCKRFL